MTEQETEILKLKDALKWHTFWLKGCLDCQDFVWDNDQYEAAMWCYDEAMLLLKGEQA